MKLDFNFDGKTLLKKWWQQVKSNFQTVQDEYNTLEDNLSEEINQRVNLGNDLTDKITKETSDRKTADSSIEGKISTETSDRKKADSSLEIKISDEVNSRQEADDELSGRIEYEKMERQSDNEENKSRFFEKADKTELYGREKNITHKITHSLKKSDFIININAGNGNGTVTINSLSVQTKIFRDGRAYIQTAPISASFSAEKGEEGEKWINLLYDCDNGTLGLEVTEQPESGNVAKMNVTYMKAEVAEIYAGIIRFEGLNTLDALKTNNRDSFVGAINELVSGKVGANDIVNGNQYVKLVEEYAQKEESKVVMISAKIEEELSMLDDDDRQMFLEDLGLEESGLDKLVKEAYSLLGLCTFFTAGEKECRAWTFKKGMLAPQCAGVIHSDFERGFIRAEIVSYDDLIACGTHAAAREKGLVRLEGKDYVVQDGDIIVFRFNV